MSDHIGEYYSQFSDESPKSNFHRVIILHAAADVDWNTISQTVPALPKGWYELCQLSQKDRIQFTLDYWLAVLPYHPKVDQFLVTFFNLIEDVGVYITQQKYEDPFKVDMVYCLKNNRGFFRGGTPATEDEIIDLQKLFPKIILPEDYLAFLRIHNGFCKSTDSTGITCSKRMSESYQQFQELLKNQPPVTTKSNEPVNPQSLIPFYESFGMPYYQCFWSEWYPEQEMGNVYYSAAENAISDEKGARGKESELMSFSTFLDWLMFYLEQIE